MPQDIYYVPQKPYTTIGSLREQLVYPLSLQQAVEALPQGARCCPCCVGMGLGFGLFCAKNDELAIYFLLL